MWFFSTWPSDGRRTDESQQRTHSLQTANSFIISQANSCLLLGAWGRSATSLPPASSSASPSSLPPRQWPLHRLWALLTIQKDRDGDHLIDCHWLNYCSLGGLSRGNGSFLRRSFPFFFFFFFCASIFSSFTGSWKGIF